MSKQANLATEEQYDSLTRLARPGDWPRATDEVENTGFAEGVISEKICHFYPRRNSHVKGHGWTFYRGTDDAEHGFYIVCNNLPTEWMAFGCSETDYHDIVAAFEANPFMLER